MIGACLVVVESTVTQTIQEQIPEHHLAGTLGIADSVMVLGALLGTILAPPVAAALGPRVSLLLVALVCLATAPLSGAVRSRVVVPETAEDSDLEPAQIVIPRRRPPLASGLPTYAVGKRVRTGEPADLPWGSDDERT